MDYKINCEIQRLIKMGLKEDLAIVVAHANNGQDEQVAHYIELMKQENNVLLEELNKFVPFSIEKTTGEVINANTTDENKEPDIQHQLKECN